MINEADLEKARRQQEEEMDGDYNPFEKDNLEAKIDQFANHEEDEEIENFSDMYSDEEDLAHEERFVER